MDRPGDLDHQPAHADDAAVDLDAVEFVDLFGQRFHDARPLAVRADGRRRLWTGSFNSVVYPRR